MKHILDKDFRYTPSFDTDLRKKFKEARAKLKAEQERAEAIIKEVEQKVKPIIRGKTA